MGLIMVDDIKYKMYCKMTDKIYNVEMIDFYHKLVFPEFYKSFTMSSFPFEQVVLLPFIGLFDKDNNEVYLGDVFKDKFGTYYIVTKLKTSFYLCRKGSKTYNKVASWNILDEYTVLGNIYNNEALRKEIGFEWNQLN